jgi:methylmalonyl-CoA mutase, N-terminal domain
MNVNTIGSAAAPVERPGLQARPSGSAPCDTRKICYGPADVPIPCEDALGEPGGFPFTRGIHPTGYTTRAWTIRQVAGFRTADESNAWFKELLRCGATGLSVAFDLPTLMGCDPDDDEAQGEVGKCGVSVACVDDMRRLYDDIPLGQVSSSLIINAPAASILAMYLVTAERQDVPWAQLTGTLQNDILKEYIAQNEYLYPPAPSMRLVSDVLAFCARETPRFNPISVSGYHIREAGATAVQELAFTIRAGLEYVQHAVARGLPVDEFAPRVSFFFNAHTDFCEEVAKFRAARRLWATEMRRRFDTRDERSLRLRFHTQTSGASLTSQQPYNNIVRTAVQAMAAIMGGTQSLHTNSMDEALGLPSPEAARLALRTQQILALETGLTRVVDPFGGSYYVEYLTSELERAARDIIERIDAMGGMVAAIEADYPQQVIGESAFGYQQGLDTGTRPVVGLNTHVEAEDVQVPVFRVDEAPGRRQAEAMHALRARRDAARAERAIDEIRRAAGTTDNLMYPIVEACRADVTLGEISRALEDVWGAFRPACRF